MQLLKQKRFVRGWFAVLLLAFAVSSAFAQEDEQRKRFKHEKHGAIVFDTGEDYELKCDIYQPTSPGPHPVMLAIHGGAWRTGTKFAMFRHARILANRGYVVMSFNYRLAPEHKWPAQIHDCKHAVRWIREHAKEYDADPDFVYAFGYSAGGHLASMLATTDSDDGFEGDPQEPYAKHSTRIQGLIAGGSPMEFSWLTEDSTTLKYWLDATPTSDSEKYLNASPTTFITADDPPAVVFHGTSDGLVPTASPKTFVQRCREANIETELILSPTGHVGAFSQTSLLIESLEKLHAMLAKEKCKTKIASIVDLIVAFKQANQRFPESIGELSTFATQAKNMKSATFDEAMLNERDGKPFEIDWIAKRSPVVSEAIGVAGKKLSSEKEKIEAPAETDK